MTADRYGFDVLELMIVENFVDILKKTAGFKHK